MATATTVSQAVLDVISANLGPIAPLMLVTPLQSDKQRISVYTKVNVAGTGFTPGAVVTAMIFGILPDDVPAVEMTADAAGAVRGTIVVGGDPSTSFRGTVAIVALEKQSIIQKAEALLQNPPSVSQLTIPVVATAVLAVDDANPPVSVATVSGPLDRRNVFLAAPHIRITATDDISGVQYIEYSLTGGRTWIRGPVGIAELAVDLPPNAVVHFMWRATDKASTPNVEDIHDGGIITSSTHLLASNGTGESLIIDSSSGSLTGPIHSNGWARISNNTGLQISGPLESVSGGNVTSGNTGPTFPAITTGAPSLSNIDYQEDDFIPFATAVFPCTLVIDSVNTKLGGVYVVHGDVIVSAVHLNANTTIAMSGSLQDFSTGSTWIRDDSTSGVLFIAGKDAHLSSTNNYNFGFVQAPNGTVTVDATTLTLDGALYGKVVKVTGATTLKATYNPSVPVQTLSLPLTGAFSAPPTGSQPPAPTAPAPTASSPRTGSVTLAWTPVRGAAGYVVEVASDSSFSNVVARQASLGTDTTMTISTSGTLYWRCAAIVRSTTGSWSTVSSFASTTATATPQPTSTPVSTTPPPTSTVTPTSPATPRPTNTPAPTSTATPTSKPPNSPTPTATGGPTLISPADGSTVGSTRPILQWLSGGSSVILYHVEINPSSSFSPTGTVGCSTTLNTVTNTTSFSVPLNLCPKTLYFWRIKSTLMTGQDTPYSMVRTFTTP